MEVCAIRLTVRVLQSHTFDIFDLIFFTLAKNNYFFCVENIHRKHSKLQMTPG